MVYDSIDVQRGERDVVRFFPTVPFGCEYSQTSPGTDCYLTLFISDNTTHDTCESNTIQHQCTVQLKGLTKEDNNAAMSWAINSTFEVITAESKLGSYNLANRHFTLRLSTGITYHTFWQDYESETVTVNVYERETSQMWQGRECQVHCDPHHLTFDGMRFELQYPGKFLLFKSTDPPMQVQVEIQSCYNSGAPYCACGLVAIAGQDIYQIYTCFGKNIIKFEACNDNVLKAEMISSRVYKIYLPTGATINVFIRGGRSYNMMDIDIIPTHHEYQEQVTGLCGNFDGDKCNDCVNRGGRFPCTTPAPNGCRGGYSYHPNEFTSSFRLTEEESLLGVIPDVSLLEPYPTSNQVCVCPEGSTSLDGTEIVGSFSSTTHCTYTQYASCENNQDREMKCRQHLLLSNTRGKRSVQQNTYTHEHEREERSVVMTESEATAACSLALMTSPSYTTCVNLDISSSEIETCTADLMLTGDSTWTRFAVDRFQTACLEIIAKNSTLQEQFPDEVNAIINNTCPNSCSEQGSCAGGVCSCDEGFASDDCSFNLTSPLDVSGLENDDLCDLRYECDLILVNGPDFPYGRNYTCQFTGQMTFVNSSVRLLEVQNVTAQYQSLFGLLCDLPDVGTLPGRLGIQYSISVAMDPYDFSTAMTFVVIDSLCQTFTYTAGNISFNIKDEYCFINGVCIPAGTDNKDDLCQECDSQDSVYTWSQSKDCTVSDLLESTGGVTNHVTVIVAVTCSVVMVFILVSLGVYYWKLHTNSSSKERGDSVAAVYTARSDVVGKLHFEQRHNLNKPHQLPPLEGKKRRVFHTDNKTLPFPLKDDI
ncbi:von Willebrand factor D and EGF domain-containing protein-like [Mizuhopecten yessoensis]|uniref:von Willebrand factor D and EGF domain-containing protein n=1 Tax=Mizuhopecten yessoensis TaxID=6573 RepID=A0A210R2J9_MIZYE|nr:von Willebrand factor D and EGF domain-containing protein-like [Mizuhopecten yessoensis]OWF55174.1 von Willebrand factor D and EGF domain-containing protein [Mizuhopecten yessoensis]